MYPADLKYTKDHEWVRVDGDTGTVGITDFAQQQLGDVVYVDLPEVGRDAQAGRPSARSNRSRRCPSSTRRSAGEVTEVNTALEGQAGEVNTTPHETWMIKAASSANAAETRRSARWMRPEPIRRMHSREHAQT